MPRRVQPYGSADDVESAALLHGRAGGDREFASGLASAMTVGDIARQAAETIRVLADLTCDGGEAANLDDARDVVQSLEQIGQDLPHMCEQLARIPVVQREDGQITNNSAEDPDFLVSEAVEALAAAGQGADMMTAALTQAIQALAGLKAVR